MEFNQCFFQNSGSFERTTMNPWRGTSNKSSINKGLLLVPPRANVKNERFLIFAQLIAPAALLGRRAGRALLAACVFVLASCSSPFWRQEEIPAGTVIVDIAGSLAAGRTIVADFASLANKLELTLTKGGETIESKTIEKAANNPLATTTTFTNLVPGNYAISIGVFKDSALLGSGSTFVTIGTGTGSAIPIPITYTKASTGSFSFTLQLPSGVSATGLACSWVGTGPTQPVSITSTQNQDGIWTIAGSGIQSGDWTLKILIENQAYSNGVLGFIHETIQVRDSVESDRWIDTDSALTPTRVVSAEELQKSSALLDSLEIRGLADNTGAPRIFSYAINGDPIQNAGLCTADSIELMAVAGVPGQTISAKINDGNPVTVQPGIPLSFDISSEETDDVNILTLTVTSPSGHVNEYTINIYKAYKVRFNILNLTSDELQIPSMLLVQKSKTINNPVTQTDNTRWSTKADFSESWNFNTPITENLTLHAQIYPPGDILIPEGTYSSEGFRNLFTDNLEKTFHLLGDVDIDDSWSTQLGGTGEGNGFKGTFRGYGHTISLNEGSSISFFGDNRGAIRDLKVVIPEGKTATSGPIFLYDNYGTISYCTAQGTLSANQQVGGFARFNIGTINACHTRGELNRTSYDYCDSIGGLVSQNQGNISFSTNSMSIYIDSNNEANQIGGLVASNTGSITHSSSSGTITISGKDVNFIGGLVGVKNGNGKISNSFSSSAITIIVNQNSSSKASDIGGLVGKALYGTGQEINITNCSALGSLTVTNNGSNNIEHVGGFIGFLDAASYRSTLTIEITNCFASNSVSINKNADSVGGFIGGISGDASSTDTRTLEKCYAIGNINTGDTGKNIGGFIGSMSGTGAPSISNCYARGDVKAQTNVAGFVGESISSTFSNCYSSGTVTLSNGTGGSFYCGGFIAHEQNPANTYTNCFYDYETTGAGSGPQTGWTDKAIGKYTTEMKNIETFKNAFGSISETLGDSTTWGIDTTDTINDGYPYLQCFGAATVTP